MSRAAIKRPVKIPEERLMVWVPTELKRRIEKEQEMTNWSIRVIVEKALRLWFARRVG